MRALRTFLVLGVLLGLSATPAFAQHAQTREGFWIGFGLGYGSMGLGCDGCTSPDRESSYSGFLKMGGRIGSSLLLGGETDGWTKSEDGATVTMANASLALYWYPMVENGLFLKGGAGYSTIRVEVDGLGSDSEGGLGLVAGAGYDLRVGANTSLTPVVNYFRGSFDGFSANVFQFGLGFTFH
jgi:outer membrane autotransporter protein